ncbi:MAG: DUF1850 domain-containing protein [Desulfohalobiaceae bacterium]|nr:DUF1850 domain-containing protein [Desulfohalobiaceae bacterium]
MKTGWPKAKISLIVLSLLLVAIFFVPVHWVNISLPRQKGRLVASRLASPGDLICISYLHSVEKTPVKGWFALDTDQGLLAVETWTTAAGTGLPNVVNKNRVRWEDGWLVVEEGNKALPEIPFFFWPINNLKISFRNAQIDLKTVEPGNLLLIRHQKTTAYAFLFRKIFCLDNNYNKSSTQN